MNITPTSGKRISASHRDSFIAQSNHTTIRKPWKSLATVAFGLFLSAPGLSQAQYTFFTIDVPKATATLANGNSTNAIVGQFDDADGKTHGFVLKNGTFTTIDVPDALDPGVFATSVNGINAPGQLVGTYFVGTTNHAFFENNGSFIKLDPANVKSQGGSINAQGQVVGTYRGVVHTPDTINTRHGFIWLNGNFTTFNVPGDDPVLGTVAFGINDVGAVVGDYVAASDGIRHGFLRSSKGAFTTIDVPVPGGIADITIGEGINNAGTIVGVYVANGNMHGFVLKNSVFTTVDVFGQPTEINSINANGEIVGFYNDSQGVAHGFRGVPTR
jgi:hypothetical protein